MLLSLSGEGGSLLEEWMDPAQLTGCAAGVNNRDLGFFVTVEASLRIEDCL